MERGRGVRIYLTRGERGGGEGARGGRGGGGRGRERDRSLSPSKNNSGGQKEADKKGGQEKENEIFVPDFAEFQQRQAQRREERERQEREQKAKEQKELDADVALINREIKSHIDKEPDGEYSQGVKYHSRIGNIDSVVWSISFSRDVSCKAFEVVRKAWDTKSEGFDLDYDDYDTNGDRNYYEIVDRINSCNIFLRKERK